MKISKSKLLVLIKESLEGIDIPEVEDAEPFEIEGLDDDSFRSEELVATKDLDSLRDTVKIMWDNQKDLYSNLRRILDELGMRYQDYSGKYPIKNSQYRVDTIL